VRLGKLRIAPTAYQDGEGRDALLDAFDFAHFDYYTASKFYLPTLVYIHPLLASQTADRD